MRSRRSQAPAHSAAARRCTQRSVRLRSSDVSCVILPRLGASDAAPASSIQLSARTAAPRPAPRRTPTTRYSPARYNLGPQQATSSAHCRRSQAPVHSAAASDARSVPMRFSDVSCVILPRLGASDAAPSSPAELPAQFNAPRPAPRKTPPAATAHSAAARRCTQRTVEVQRCQLRHP